MWEYLLWALVGLMCVYMVMMVHLGICRWPDDIVWAWPNRCFLWGWDKQEYSYDAVCYSMFFGPLTVRWHKR